MASVHIVKQGEHLSQIAFQYGFSHYRTIWDHPQNAALKELRKNPNVLFPGDTLFIPDRDIKIEDRPTNKRHNFKLSGDPLRLRIVLARIYGKPFANAPCVLVVDADRTALTSDGSGKIEKEIAKTAAGGSLTVKDQIAVKDATIPVDREIRIKIGHLDPVKEVSGQQARLANLGYYRGADEPLDPDEFLSAVEEFQCEHTLAVDGKCGPLTQAKLIAAHGC